MRYLITLILIQIASINLIGQGLDKLEIWGWEDNKEDFVKIYLDSTGKNLNVNYTCMADLQKLGYKTSYSTAYINGQTNWNDVERFAIIRQVEKSKYSELASDSIKNRIIAETVTLLQSKDSLKLSEHFSDYRKDLNHILTGTLSSDMMLRYQCLGILRKAKAMLIEDSEEAIEIIGHMLSYPDPSVAYLAMNLGTTLAYEHNSKLFSPGALTIIDMLNSNLQTFKVDALNFLSQRETDSEVKTSADWEQWINQFHE